MYDSILHIRVYLTYRVAEVVQGHGGPLPKSLDSNENFMPEHTLFGRELRFVVIYAPLGDLLAIYCIYCIFYRVKFANL